MARSFDTTKFVGFTKAGKDTIESMGWQVTDVREWMEYKNSKRTDHRLGTYVTLQDPKSLQELVVKTAQKFDDDLISKHVHLVIDEVKIYARGTKTTSDFATVEVSLTVQIEEDQSVKQPQK